MLTHGSFQSHRRARHAGKIPFNSADLLRCPLCAQPCPPPIPGCRSRRFSYAGVLKLVAEKSCWRSQASEDTAMGAPSNSPHRGYFAEVSSFAATPIKKSRSTKLGRWRCRQPNHKSHQRRNQVRGAVHRGLSSVMSYEITIDAAVRSRAISRISPGPHEQVPRNRSPHFLKTTIHPLASANLPFRRFSAVCNASLPLRASASVPCRSPNTAFLGLVLPSDSLPFCRAPLRRPSRHVCTLYCLLYGNRCATGWGAGGLRCMGLCPDIRDGAEVKITSCSYELPWHDLQEIAYEWRFPGPVGKAVCDLVADNWGRMNQSTPAADLHKLSERAASFRQPGFIWRQVAQTMSGKFGPAI